jgi:hypothetical protein
MNKRFLYDYGLPFSEKLGENLDDIRQRVLGKKASLIIVDGGVGEGKTTLGAHIGEYYDKGFDYRAQIGMGGDKFLKAARWCAENKKNSVVYDEAGDFSKRGAISSFNRILVRFFETYRAFKIIPIICLPRFWILDNHVFDLGIPQILIHCYGRDFKQGNLKAYDLEGMYYLKENVKKMVVKPKVYGTARPNFYGHFLDLPEEKAKALELLSMRGKKNIIDEAYIEANNLIDVYGIARKVDKSIAWVKGKIRKHNIKHIDLIQRRKYYDATILRKIYK